MKKITLSIFAFIAISASAQTAVYLNINHKLGLNNFAFNTQSSNNMNNPFSVDRMEYYLSNFILVHDAGTETAITDLHALVNGGNETQISLGSLNFTTIEGIKFSVGVDAAFNHLDPSTYPQTDPLAPKNPSMHWGWTSGYRFVAMEGSAGSALSTGFEIHALGDQNYFEVNVILLEGTAENGNMYLNIDADYTAAIKDIDVTSGVITHGDFGEAIDLLNNFQSEVFKATVQDTTSPTGIANVLNSTPQINVFPNPSKGLVTIALEELSSASSVQVYDMVGALINTFVIENSSPIIHIQENGSYYITLLNSEGTPVAHSKILIE